MLGYDMAIWCMWMMAGGSNYAFRIAAKSLQIDMMTAYRNSSPTLMTFGLATIHALQTDDDG